MSLSTATYTPTSFSPGLAPPPPPKPSRTQNTSNSTPQFTANNGPPLPPPPPIDESSSYDSRSQPPPSQPLPPTLEDQWLPSTLLDKSTSNLQHLASSPALLKSLVQSPESTHPSILPSPIPTHLAHLSNTATNLSSQHALLLSLRSQTQNHLLHLHALERQWRTRQSTLDDALAPWAPKALYTRLVHASTEAEQVCGALEETFLEGEGKAGDREVGDFLRRYREGRKGVWRRRENRKRWDEGRVGGWR